MGLIADVIREIIDTADEAKQNWNRDRKSDIEYGRVLAFSEVLSMLRDEFVGHEEIEKLLSFDIDKRYACD